MQKTVYENYKYSLQDTAKVYIGAKYTLQSFWSRMMWRLNSA